MHTFQNEKACKLFFVNKLHKLWLIKNQDCRFADLAKHP